MHFARRAGAEVVERTSAGGQGKGYALAAGVDHIEPAPPDVVMVIDADMLTHDGTIDALARTCDQTGQPVQAVYVLDPPAKPQLNDLLSSLAFTIQVHTRPTGLLRLGLPCRMMGTGMAFPYC